MNIITHNLKTTKFHTDRIIKSLSFNAFDEIPFINHLFSTRFDGFSKDHLSSLNLSFTRGDEPDTVIKNFEKVASYLEVSINDFVLTNQTHTTNVEKVGISNKGTGITSGTEFKDVDGLITNEKGVVLSTFYADCVPLYFVDTKNKAIGLSHSGWKGTVNRMGQATLLKMKECFNTDPKDVLCAVGPSICTNCYEVSEDVALNFIEQFNIKEVKDYNKEKLKYPSENFSVIINSPSDLINNIESETPFMPDIIYKKNDEKYQLNLHAANIQVLMDAGVPIENISLTNMCTCCNPDILFSHRASKGMRGNLGAFLMLK